MPDYIDTSAAAKLVTAEEESQALRAFLLAADGPPVASDLARTELVRAARRMSLDLTAAARAVLDTFVIIKLSTETYDRAALLEPRTLRSLDALHLAAAMTLGDDLNRFVTYDQRLAEAATNLGLRVACPS